MSKNLKNQLIDNIPSSLKNNDLIIQYMEAVGDVYEEIKSDIEYKDFETDYAKSRFLDLNKVSSNIGLNLNPYLSEDVTRRTIRDMPVIFSSLGTRPALEWIFKTLGYENFEIGEVWAPNPDLIRMGHYRQLGSSKDPIRYDVDRNSHIDFVIGDSYVDDAGTFFKGHSYLDFTKSNEYTKIPIYGESYQTYTGIDFKDMVSKTPYVNVRLNGSPDYSRVITDTDPINGGPINVSDYEKQIIVTSMMLYMVHELQRAATVSIRLAYFVDLVSIIPSLLDSTSFEYTSDPAEFLYNLPIKSKYNANGYVHVNSRSFERVGCDRLIGGLSPVPSTGEYMASGRFGHPFGRVSRDILEEFRQVNYKSYAVKPSEGYEHVHFLDYEAFVSFTAPVDSEVGVYKVRNHYYSERSDWKLLRTVPPSGRFFDFIPDSHTVVLKFTSNSNLNTEVNSTYLYPIVGDKQLIGKSSPFLQIGVYMSVGVVGRSPAEILGFYKQDLMTTVVNPEHGYNHVHFLADRATVEFIAPEGVNVTIKSSKNFNLESSSEWVTVAEVQGGETFNQIFNNKHAAIFEFHNSYDGEINITSTYQ